VNRIQKKVRQDFLLRELAFGSRYLFVFFFVFAGFVQCTPLPKEIQAKDLSSRHSNAARVSENIRLQRRGAIFAASVIDAIFLAWSQRSDFPLQNRVLQEKMELLLLLLLRACSWRIVMLCVGFSEKLAKFSFIGKVHHHAFFNGKAQQWKRTVIRRMPIVH